MSAIQQHEASQFEREVVDFGVKDIAEAPISLMSRENDGLVVNLWLIRATSRKYVTVEDIKGLAKDEVASPRHLEVPENHNPLDKRTGRYWHPMAYLVD